MISNPLPYWLVKLFATLSQKQMEESEIRSPHQKLDWFTKMAVSSCHEAIYVSSQSEFPIQLIVRRFDI